MGCQTAIAGQIVTQGGDYVLALKENHADLRHEAAHLFADAGANGGEDYEREGAETFDGGHGRVERRRYRVLRDARTLAHLDPDERSEGLRRRARDRGAAGGVATRETRYYRSGFSRQRRKACR
jgi:hypothetical protein